MYLHAMLIYICFMALLVMVVALQEPYATVNQAHEKNYKQTYSM
jgi:hypothetical protein